MSDQKDMKPILKKLIGSASKWTYPSRYLQKNGIKGSQIESDMIPSSQGILQ